MNVKIRSEVPSEGEAIGAITAAAFRKASHSSGTEHFIVHALRQAGQLTISLVAEDDGVIVGHVAVSPVRISDGTDRWYGLGPISVAPQWQGRGIGGQLMKRALADLRQRGAAGCVVLGDPNYYGRFGFRAEPTLVLPDIPPEYFQAIAWHDAVPSGTVSYHGAFHADD